MLASGGEDRVVAHGPHGAISHPQRRVDATPGAGGDGIDARHVSSALNQSQSGRWPLSGRVPAVASREGLELSVPVSRHELSSCDTGRMRSKRISTAGHELNEDENQLVHPAGMGAVQRGAGGGSEMAEPIIVNDAKRCCGWRPDLLSYGCW